MQDDSFNLAGSRKPGCFFSAEKCFSFLVTRGQEKILQQKNLSATKAPLLGFVITVQPGLNVLGASSISSFPAMVGPEIADIRPMTGSST